MNLGNANSGLMFAQWLKRNYPQLYADAIRRIGTDKIKLGQVQTFPYHGYNPNIDLPQVQTMTADQTEDKAWWEKLADVAGNLATTYFQYKSQKDLIEMNADRAKQGLPPLEASEVGPHVTVEHETPGIVNTLKSMGWPVILGAGILGYMALKDK